MATRTWRSLYELAGLYETLQARVAKGELDAARMEAELGGVVGVDEHGRRWTVDGKGRWREVDAAGSGEPATPETEAAERKTDEAELDKALGELEKLVGLDVVKKQVKQLTALVRVQGLRRAARLPVPPMSHHLVFRGNPGTGKTTVARLIGRIYAALDIVGDGHLVEVDRSKLVAEYVGHTAIKTSAAFEEARGGLLFIDEAYALARDAGSSSGFGQEAIDTLVKLMEDHRDDTVVVAAGYPEPMDEFIESNPGLRSRFSRTVDFPDYTDDELIEIFRRMCRDGGYSPTPEARERVRQLLAASDRGPGFGNARAVRTLFERAVVAQAERLAEVKKPSPGQLRRLTASDVAPRLA